MIIKVDKNTCIVFDLDDTLYLEYDFLKSGFRHISKELFSENSHDLYVKMLSIFQKGGNVFEYLIANCKEKEMALDSLLYLYRNHMPTIFLNEGVLDFFRSIKSRGGKIGLITDGRSITQRNKIKALNIELFFDDIIISEEFGSEKPCVDNYQFFINKYTNYNFIFFGDNPQKDFISPKRLNWLCIGLINNLNIHKSNIEILSNDLLPHVFLKSFKEINVL